MKKLLLILVLSLLALPLKAQNQYYILGSNYYNQIDGLIPLPAAPDVLILRYFTKVMHPQLRRNVLILRLYTKVIHSRIIVRLPLSSSCSLR